MFKKILIANRGEIALRVICACKELGIRTVAIYSEADRNSLHVRFADEAICIGPPQLAQSYLNIPSVISAAEISQRGRHPSRLRPAGGKRQLRRSRRDLQHQVHRPAPEITRLMGEKEKARAAMKRAGVPILPGSEGILASDGEALEWARQVGFPVIIKASAGGGGRGMRIVRSEEELPALFKAASSEAAAAFGNGDLYMEKFVERPRHIEFQVLADQYGNVVSLGERECSIQRRHQKLLEESPSTQVSPELREQIGQVLCKTLSDVGYVNAGTIEFLMDEDRKLYFIEMNTRIQVEHPVTEMVTDVDLVKSQILLAAGERLENVLHGPILHRGHAIECRINAEHPEKFTPSAGKITTFNPPGGTGVRIDTAAYAEGVIPPYYDSLIAKLIVRGKDRDEAVSRMSRARWRCSSSRAFSRPFHCTAEFWPIPISEPGKSIPRLLRRFLAQAKRERPADKPGVEREVVPPKVSVGFRPARCVGRDVQPNSADRSVRRYKDSMILPRLYAILDSSCFPDTRSPLRLSARNWSRAASLCCNIATRPETPARCSNRPGN